MPKVTHYYASRYLNGQYFGIVYHWDGTGNRRIVDHRTNPCGSEHSAMDTASEWADENGIDAEADFDNYD